jgi:hypothetical protein
VDRPYADVCRLLAKDPERVLGHPGDTDAVREQRTGLHVRRAGVDLSREVRIVRGDLVLDEDAARLPLRWEDAERPNLFPVLEVTLELVPVPAGRRSTTQVGLTGRYRPPFGRLGAVADTLAGHKMVLESVDRFLDEITGRIEAEVEPRAPAPEASGSPVSGLSSERRVFLPVESLGRFPGGALALRERLSAEPGVRKAMVDAVAGMAVIDYNATVCSLGRLLAAMDEGNETA